MGPDENRKAERRELVRRYAGHLAPLCVEMRKNLAGQPEMVFLPDRAVAMARNLAGAVLDAEDAEDAAPKLSVVKP